MASRKPVFAKDGTVTAGNASQISDGAAAVTVMSDRAVERLDVKPLARVIASATTGVDPELVMMGKQAIDNDYLIGRGVTNETVQHFNLKYHAQDDCIVIPIGFKGESFGLSLIHI
mgnify:CR=1 FL=1